MTPRVRVVGCGNPDAGDDAAGLVIANLLRSRMPSEVEVRTATAGGASLLNWCDDIEFLILVDAAHAREDLPPGQWRRFTFPDDRQRLRSTILSGTHVLGIMQALELAHTLGRVPGEVLLFVVAGSQFGLGTGLSPTVEQSLPEVAGEVETEVLHRLRHTRDQGCGIAVESDRRAPWGMNVAIELASLSGAPAGGLP